MKISQVSVDFKHILILLTLIQTIHGYTFLNKRTSYLLYKQWNAKTYGKLKFKFKTHNPSGLLLYSDNSETKNSINENFIAIKLNYRKIEITIQMGGEDYLSKKKEEIGENLDDLEWHTIEVLRDNRKTTVTLDSIESVVIENKGEVQELELNSGVYFGGISRSLEKKLRDKTILALPRFMGCIEDIEFSTKYEIPTTDNKQTNKSTGYSNESTEFTKKRIRNVGSTKNQPIIYVMGKTLVQKIDVSDDCLDACKNYTCPNKGRCKNHFRVPKCDCVGTGFYGKDCQKVSDSIEFKGKSYVTVTLPGALQTTTSNKVILRFKTHQSNGLLLASRSGNDHLMMELRENTIRLSVNLGGGNHVYIINNIAFNDGKWHLVELIRNGKDVLLTADREYKVEEATPNIHTKLDLRDHLYIGGHPNAANLRDINSLSRQNFTGCLQQVYFNEIDIIYKKLNTNSALYRKVGNITKGCQVQPKRNMMSRETDGSSVSKSGPGKENGGHPQAKSTIPAEIVDGKQVDSDKTGKLSKKTIVWIAVGLVVGSILIIIVIVFIVNSVRSRYSDLIFVKNMKNNNDLLNNMKRKHSEAITFIPRNGKVILQPELV